MSVKNYMNYVHQEHLPVISKSKVRELQATREQLEQPKIILPRATSPNVYNTVAYKKDLKSYMKSVDWSGKKNPMIPLPKEEHKFMKIDYLRVQSKSDVLNGIELNENSAYMNMTKKSNNPLRNSMPDLKQAKMKGSRINFDVRSNS